MTSRSKKGLGFVVSGVVFVGAGIVLMLTTSTPSWVETALSCISAVCSVVGLALVVPDLSSSS